MVFPLISLLWTIKVFLLLILPEMLTQSISHLLHSPLPSLPPQIHLLWGVAGRDPELLLLDGSDGVTVCDPVVSARLHLHTNSYSCVGKATTWRGREPQRPTDGSLKEKGKWGGHLKKYKSLSLNTGEMKESGLCSSWRFNLTDALVVNHWTSWQWIY